MSAQTLMVMAGGTGGHVYPAMAVADYLQAQHWKIVWLATEGGMENRYVQGDGDGTSDDVAAMLADGEFVIPADVVSRLGNGSSNAGAHVLDQFLSIVREDKNDHDPHELPPDSKGPLAYLAMAQKKA